MSVAEQAVRWLASREDLIECQRFRCWMRKEVCAARLVRSKQEAEDGTSSNAMHRACKDCPYYPEEAERKKAAKKRNMARAEHMRKAKEAAQGRAKKFAWRKKAKDKWKL